MLSYDDALARILAQAAPLPAETVPLGGALCRALAEDVVADADLPPFDNSAVDGYALHAADAAKAAAGGHTVGIGPEVPAGSAADQPVTPGIAIPIYTGSPVPQDTAAVVMWEDTERLTDGSLRLRSPGSEKNVRRAGSDLPRGATALRAGDTIDAGAIGLLAALNRASVESPRRPRVGILATGDELVPVGDRPLGPGQIRNSSTPALTAAVEAAGGVVAAAVHAPDTPDGTRAALEELAAVSDVIVSSGGVSVGAHDYVKAAVEAVGALDFWRIAVKPGKPLAFGRIGGTLFFGLPGNPVSSLVTFELFVRPTLRRMAGHSNSGRPILLLPLAADLPHESGRREFARARLEYGEAMPLGRQDSHRLASIAGAEALVVLNENHGDYAANDPVMAILIV